jgi:hypothetical protein
MGSQSQPEAQTERAAVQLTRAEKDALRLVSLMDDITESALLRDRTVAEIVARATVIRSAMPQPAETGATP